MIFGGRLRDGQKREDVRGLKQDIHIRACSLLFQIKVIF